MRITGSYLDIRDLEITSATKNSGFVISNTHDVMLSDVKATNVKDQAIWINGSDDVVVDQCELALSSDSPEGRTDDLRIDNHSTRITIRNCLVQQSLGKGGNALVFDHADYVTFQNNELYANNNPNLLIGNGDHILIENNLITKVCNENNPGGELAKGSAITRFLGDDTRVTNPKYKSDDVEITNNLIVNPNRGMLFNGCKNKTNYPNESCDFSDTIIKNNTLVGVGMNQSGGFEGEEYAFFADLGENASTDIEFRDNLIHTKNGSAPDYQLGVFAGDLTFSGNLWSDLTNLPTQGNQLVTNWSQVFANNPNLTTCVNNRINPDTYKVTNTYNGKGADISKVGIGRGEGDTPFPTSTAGPTATDSTTPTSGAYTTDFDYDGDVDIRDLLSFIPRFDKTTAKFDVNNSGRVDVFDFALTLHAIIE